MATTNDGVRGDLLTFWDRAEWKYKYNFLFRQCLVTHETLWPFTKAYRGRVFLIEDIITLEERWLSPKAFVFKKLQGKI